MRNFLIFTSAGKSNNVQCWVNSLDRNYDLWVTNYSDQPGLLKEVADLYNERKGAKFPNFKYLVDKRREQLKHYKAIMVADDDIIISPGKLESLFNQLVDQKLWIITPAFSRLGKVSHDTTERNLTSRYRFTNFAEVTCPIFRTDKLLDFMDEYDPNLTCHGVDWWYLNHLNDTSKRKIVISDEFFCINPRDIKKPSSTREIDRCVSQKDRAEAWRRIQDSRGLTTFRKEVFGRQRENVLTVLTRLPGYLVEVVVDWLSKLSFLSPIRKLIKRCMNWNGRRSS